MTFITCSWKLQRFFLDFYNSSKLQLNDIYFSFNLTLITLMSRNSNERVSKWREGKIECLSIIFYLKIKFSWKYENHHYVSLCVDYFTCSGIFQSSSLELVKGKKFSVTETLERKILKLKLSHRLHKITREFHGGTVLLNHSSIKIWL